VIFGEVKDNLNLARLNESTTHAISKNIKFILLSKSCGQMKFSHYKVLKTSSTILKGLPISIFFEI